MQDDAAKPPHISVMLSEVLEALMPQSGKIIIDATFGAGGYSKALLEAGAKVIALDRDPAALDTANLFSEHYGADNFMFKQSNFSNLEQVLLDLNIEKVDGVVLDIGVSSMQLDQAMRGFSFNKEGPLDMRMSQAGLSAAEIVNGYSLSDLTRIFSFLGEEDESYRFAKAIVKYRETEQFTTTKQLADLIAQTTYKKIHYSQRKLHPATKIFQALRIYVNNELGELIEALVAAERVLKVDGVLAVVTFHSLEDRIVKKFFAARSNPSKGSRYLPDPKLVEPSFKPIFKGMRLPTVEEINANPRSRSAKLRAATRTAADAMEVESDLLSLRKLSYPH